MNNPVFTERTKNAGIKCKSFFNKNQIYLVYPNIFVVWHNQTNSFLEEVFVRTSCREGYYVYVWNEWIKKTEILRFVPKQ